MDDHELRRKELVLMSSSPRWTPGSRVVYREIWRGKVWKTRPAIVVQDTSEWVVLFLPRGTRWKRPAGEREQYFHYLHTGEWTLADATWLLGDTLFLLPPNEAHAVHVMWEPVNRAFVGWYVNLQEPIRRTIIGFDFMDQELDINVTPDLSRWTWKDEEHLTRAHRDGRFSMAQVNAIRAEGERVITRIQSKASPFSDGWETWTPPREWPLPNLLDGWDRIE